jgi:tetratricopeptide (TPR) repeat protein
MQDDLDQAEEWLEQVLDEFPEDTGALNDLGYLWADAGKHLDRALEMIQVAVAEDPANMAYRDSLGWALLRLGRYSEAVAELKVAAGVPDPDGVILDHLAEAQLLNGEVAAAIESWRRALSLFEEEQDAEKAQQTREKIKLAEAKATENPSVPEPKPAETPSAADKAESEKPE